MPYARVGATRSINREQERAEHTFLYRIDRVFIKTTGFLQYSAGENRSHKPFLAAEGAGHPRGAYFKPVLCHKRRIIELRHPRHLNGGHFGEVNLRGIGYVKSSIARDIGVHIGKRGGRRGNVLIYQVDNSVRSAVAGKLQIFNSLIDEPVEQDSHIVIAAVGMKYEVVSRAFQAELVRIELTAS